MDTAKSKWQVDEAGRITTAPMQPVVIERPEFAPEPQRPVEMIPVPEREEPMTFGDHLRRLWLIGKLTVRITPYILKSIVGAKMKNWKTTLGAIIGGLATILNVLGIVDISADVQMAIVTLGLFIVGLFAGDAKKDDAGNN